METVRLFGLWVLQILLLGVGVAVAQWLPEHWLPNFLATAVAVVVMAAVAAIILWQLMGLKTLSRSGRWLFFSSVLALAFLFQLSLFDILSR